VTTYRKKLVEVALPLKAINDESSRRKRKAPAGYPTTLHKWWAQRPLAACRAVLFSSLVDDPDSDPMYAGNEGLAGQKRAELFNLIEELVQWENSNNPRVINRARAEIARSIAAGKVADKVWKKDAEVVPGATANDFKQMLAKPNAVNAFLAEHAPPVLDPFCGGGSIPLEAQRLGLRAYASDLNPVPVLITKALIEIPPRFASYPPVNPEWQAKSKEEKAARVWSGAQGLAEDVRYYGRWMRNEVERQVGHLYPKVKLTKELAKNRPDLAGYVGQELRIVAWLWARTVASPNPAFQGIHVPLASAFWLSTKSGKMAWIEPKVDRAKKTYEFDVRVGSVTADARKAINAGTKLGRGCKFRCLLSDEPIAEDHIKEAGRRGELGTVLMAIVAEGDRGRVYLPPVSTPAFDIGRLKDLGRIDAPLANDPRNLWCLGYGFDTFDKLFTPRQLVTLSTFSNLLNEVRDTVRRDARAAIFPDDRNSDDTSDRPSAYAEATAVFLACSLMRAVDYNSAFASWRPKDNAMRSTLGKQAIPMVWDFAEANPLEKSSAGFADCVQVISKCVEVLPANSSAQVRQLDATTAACDALQPFVCTDPPYYDNIGYADLSDFFYVWLRRAIGNVYPSLFSTLLTPKAQELIASPYRHDGRKDSAKEFFEEGLARTFRKVREYGTREFPVVVFYAFKQSESDGYDGEVAESLSASTVTASTGWETILEGLIGANFSITGTWPMRTEGDNRQVGLGTNALASSIALVCRQRPSEARLATRKEFMTALRQDLPYALKNLQHGSIAPVDLAQAAIGPGMAVYTRYAKVIESDGQPMAVRTALGIINQVLDEVLAEQEGEFDGDSRWALAWFDQFGMGEGAFGIAETLSKAKNTSVSGLVEAGIVHARAGKVRLVRRDEMNAAWNPATDPRLTAWEVTQHLIRTLETEGESAAAALMHQLGGIAETARDLAYRLYSICERKKWAEEALAYNGLVIAWPELSKLAVAERGRVRSQTQQPLEF
jgi:putative DNA methylase